MPMVLNILFATWVQKNAKCVKLAAINTKALELNMIPLFLVLLYYHFNKHIRDFCALLIGNYYESHRDIVLVTGGCSGLGREIALKFANEAAKAGVVTRTGTPVSSAHLSSSTSSTLVSANAFYSSSRVIVLDIELPSDENRIDGVTYFQCDVGDRRQVSQIQQQISERIGNVSILVNNAGITTGKAVVDLSYEEIERTIQVNLVASFYTIKAFLPQMLQQKRGYIITIASVLGYMSPACLSAYGASKSGLIALHESLTYEMGPPSFNRTGVKTLLVCPGQIQTGMFQGVRSPSQVFAPELDPRYVASQILGAVELGRRGEIKLPFYSNFVPLFRSLPWPVVQVARAISGIDKSMKTFKDTISKISRINSRVVSVVSSAIASNSPSESNSPILGTHSNATI